MNKELMITKEDLVNWLDRPPSNDDLDLIGFITTRLENFYKLEQENKQLKLNHKQLSDINKMAICNSRLIQENKQLKDNWNKLKEITKSQSDFKLKCHYGSLWFEVDELLIKMQELEKEVKNK